MTEETLFQDGDVLVTTSRVRVGSTTYALRNITSVRVASTREADMRAAVILVAGLLVWILVFGFLGSVGLRNQFVLWLGLIPSIGLTYLFLYPRLSVPPVVYHCALATSGEEVQALSSMDRSFIEGVVNAINDAIIRIGV